ncbi:signal peptidase II [Wenzhouxiangella sediminis]|uniref:Lipoprotein signal peptidase n=1 Tax=Wenzhouxiangella sediminis TaxID=1792836 RepID=A0A3E1K7V7_9GAMM|nr:signal peptidase II [Wenzhouxiangella sediminis]RFF30102.1 lipoprotein signal peptidase [Wenzhouxiangella sediminis]
MRPGRYGLWLIMAAVVVALDLFTKELAMQYLELYRPNPVLSWLNLTLAHNTGAAFSFLASGSGWQRWFLSGVAVVIVAVLLVWLWRLPHRARLLPSALALVIGGAIGNLVDRIRFGYVIDFIDVHYAGWHWPAFNLADSAIVVGVILLLLDSLIPGRRIHHHA